MVNYSYFHQSTAQLLRLVQKLVDNNEILLKSQHVEILITFELWVKLRLWNGPLIHITIYKNITNYKFGDLHYLHLNSHVCRIILYVPTQWKSDVFSYWLSIAPTSKHFHWYAFEKVSNICLSCNWAALSIKHYSGHVPSQWDPAKSSAFHVTQALIGWVHTQNRLPRIIPDWSVHLFNAVGRWRSLDLTTNV